MRLAALEFEELYPSLNIFVDREDKFYNEVGRYEKLAEAKEIDEKIKYILMENKVSFRSFSCLDQGGMVEYIISEIG
jgi:hypothetical protein